MIRPQKEFPYLERFKQTFPITEYTIFIYHPDIFCDYPIPPDILIHEGVHLKQQLKWGRDNWIKYYVHKPRFRLRQELEAYRAQLRSLSTKEDYNEVLKECIDNLTGPLYGNLLSHKDAERLLRSK